MGELIQHQVRTIELVHGEKLVAELLALDRYLLLPFEQVVGQGLLLGETGAGDSAHSRQHVPVVRLAPFERGR